MPAISRLCGASIAAAVALSVSPSGAQNTVAVPEIVVSEGGSGSLTVAGVEEQRQTVTRNAGSVGFVDSESFRARYSNNLRDVLKDSPGVLTQERYGQELRVSIRGSAIARAFHARGVELLQDGIPFNFADGSGDYYQIDPLALRSVEIYKGGNGLAYGSSYLGGAINFVTPTARTAIAPNVARIDGGAFGTLRGNFQTSRIWENVDVLANLTVSHSEGYRDHSRQDYTHFNGNVGIAIAPGVESRFYAGVYHTDQKLPGTLSLGDALDRPRLASASALSGDQARNVRVERLGNRTSFALDTGKIDLDSWVMHKNLYHPIFQVIDQDGFTYGIAPRYSGMFDIGGFRNETIAGLRYFGGYNDARQFINIAGNRGAQTLNARQVANNYEAFFENRFFFLRDVAFVSGAKASRSERSYTDFGGLAANPLAKADSKTFNGLNPKAGLLWQPRSGIDVFANITRSQDVPDFSDLNQTVAATQRFVPLNAQRAWTGEIGTRGVLAGLTWDVTVFRSQVRDELLQFTVAPGVPASTFNALRTVHQGVELGLSAEVLRGLLGVSSGDTLTVAQLWNYSDFRFDGDPQYGNNMIAGVPQHVLRTVITYRHPSGFFLAPSVDFAPKGAYVDYANTLRVPGYAIFGLQTGWERDGWLVYVEGRNLTDRRAISDFGTVTDARTANTAVFYPVNGRGVFAGLRYAFDRPLSR